jgi:hypothetical protein
MKSVRRSGLFGLIALFVLSGLEVACPGLGRAAEATEKGRSIFAAPDGKYAVRFDPEEDNMTTVSLIEVKSGRIVLELGSIGRPWIKESAAFWSPDSQRLAFMSGSRRGGQTTLYARKGGAFEEVPMPESSYARIKGAPEGAKTVLAAQVPIRWTKPNVLLLESNVETDIGGGATSRMLLTFDENNRVKVMRAK